LPRHPLHWLMADMVAADTVGVADMVATEAAAFMVVTQVDFMDAVPTSLAVAIGADTAAATAEPTVDTADTTMDPVL
jgi:hypothetical protein